MLSNNHFQIRGIKKTDEGLYTCEARLMSRGEIDLRVIKVIVNGRLPTHTFAVSVSGVKFCLFCSY